ncbi:MAG: hypothetical protein KatS3mg102_1755 [Planctomycetota bacterium]|nr:MAG: hypothetical protein KatS3mg102_1755 [Planctomycetota bacterium]
MIFFATKYFPCADRLLPIKPNARRLASFVMEQEIPTAIHMNRGNIYDPLLLALEMPEVDTVFLLSEGNPTEGRFVEQDRFIRHLQRENRFAKTRVEALFIGNAASARGYMRAIAEATGGRFYDIARLKGW